MCTQRKIYLSQSTFIFSEKYRIYIYVYMPLNFATFNKNLYLCFYFYFVFSLFFPSSPRVRLFISFFIISPSSNKACEIFYAVDFYLRCCTRLVCVSIHGFSQCYVLGSNSVVFSSTCVLYAHLLGFSLGEEGFYLFVLNFHNIS